MHCPVSSISSSSFPFYSVHESPDHLDLFHSSIPSDLFSFSLSKVAGTKACFGSWYPISNYCFISSYLVQLWNGILKVWQCFAHTGPWKPMEQRCIRMEAPCHGARCVCRGEGSLDLIFFFSQVFFFWGVTPPPPPPRIRKQPSFLLVREVGDVPWVPPYEKLRCVCSGGFAQRSTTRGNCVWNVLCTWLCAPAWKTWRDNSRVRTAISCLNILLYNDSTLDLICSVEKSAFFS